MQPHWLVSLRDAVGFLGAVLVNTIVRDVVDEPFASAAEAEATELLIAHPLCSDIQISGERLLDEPDDDVTCSDEVAVSVVATTVEKFEQAATPRSRGHGATLASDIVQRLPILLRRGNMESDEDSDDDCTPRTTSSFAAAVLCACRCLGDGVPSGALALCRKLPRLRWHFAFCSVRAGFKSFADAGKAMMIRQRMSRMVAASLSDASKTKLLGPAGLVRDFLQTLFANASSSFAHDSSALQVIRSRLRVLMDTIARKRKSTAAIAAALNLEQRLLDVRALLMPVLRLCFGGAED